jgi:hypothetical protein
MAQGSYKQPQRTTPWSASAAASRGPQSVPGPGARVAATQKQQAPSLSQSAFPSLAPSAAARQKVQVSGNTSLKKILGESVPATSAWSAAGGSGSGTPVDEAAPASEEPPATGKGKKKGKQKQTLFTLGNFQTS